MKVLYKNKIGKLVSLYTSIYCDNCIYRPKGTSLNRCKKIGLMELCVGASKYHEFTSSSSDILTYEN
jgi:hypothetical protein